MSLLQHGNMHPRAPGIKAHSRAFLLVLGLLGLTLSATIVPGVFTIDEENYLVSVLGLRRGQLGLPGTEGLSPSRELAYFDPGAHGRAYNQTPVVSSAPPLYAPIAAPFALLGWQGLFLLNILAYLVTTWLVFHHVRRFALRPETPWLAAATFALASFSIEYAQAMWPHMLSVALATGGITLATRAGLPAIFVAGALMGVAVGIRYQNVILVAGVGAGVLAWSARRIRATLAYAVGAALPLGACAVINHLRYGSFNPISKGTGYLVIGVGKTAAPGLATDTAASGDTQQSLGPLVEALRVAWAKIFDYSSHPPFSASDPGRIDLVLTPSATTGAFVIIGAIKKALLQSAPWMLLALVVLLVAWRPRRGGSFFARATGDAVHERRRLSIPVLSVLAAFSLAGFARHDGLCFNQRYFLEIMPLGAIALWLAIEPIARQKPSLALGAIIGVLAALTVVLFIPPGTARELLVLRAPLILAFLLVGAWVLVSLRRFPRLFSGILGASLAWALVAHVGDDIKAARWIRHVNLAVLDVVRGSLPPDARVALLTWSGHKVALGPLHLERDVVVTDAWIDNGTDAPRLVDELASAGRRIFVFHKRFPPEVLSAIAKGRRLVAVDQVPDLLSEIVAPARTGELDL